MRTGMESFWALNRRFTIQLKTHCAAEPAPARGESPELRLGSARAMNQPVKTYRLGRQM
jgi:hypothetical protein